MFEKFGWFHLAEIPDQQAIHHKGMDRQAENYHQYIFEQSEKNAAPNWPIDGSQQGRELHKEQIS